MLIDSNILIYAINSASPKHQAAQKFLETHINELEFAHQNILETIRVLTHPKFVSPMGIKEAAMAISAILEAGKMITPSQTSLYFAVELVKRHSLSGNRIFDAYLAATALSQGINTIATDNEVDFKKFKGLKVINPFR